MFYISDNQTEVLTFDNEYINEIKSCMVSVINISCPIMTAPWMKNQTAVLQVNPAKVAIVILRQK